VLFFSNDVVVMSPVAGGHELQHVGQHVATLASESADIQKRVATFAPL
jgi:predicted aldo/keto reductase-like oxidoreductase